MDKVTAEVHAQLLLVGINRPEKRHKFDLDVLSGLAAAHTRSSGDAELRCGVIFGHGEHFTTGLELMSVLPVTAAKGPSAYLEPGRCDPFANFARPCSRPIVIAQEGMLSSFEKRAPVFRGR